MTQIPYGIQSYARSDLPRIKLINLFVEKVPDVKGGIALLPRPALVAYQTLGTGPIRGMFHQDGVLEGKLIALSGHELYGDGAIVGTIDGSGRVSMAAADIYLLIATGSRLYRLAGTDTAQIAFPDDNGVSDVAYLGGYAIAVQQNSRHLYFTLDSATWDGLDYISAELSTAPIVCIQVVADQLWVFCTDHTEVFYLSGDSTAPLQRVQGRLFEKGCRAQFSIVGLDNTVFWVGNDQIVYRGDNVPVRVSDHGIEELIRSSAYIEAFAFKWIGHLFYVLRLDEGTFAYDVATGQWHQLMSYGRTDWRINQVVLVGLDYIASDTDSGDLWKLEDGIYKDGDTQILCEFTVLEDSPIFLDNVVVNCSTGATASPDAAPGLLEMRVSRDQGQTFGSWRQCPLGTLGQTRKRAVFRRCGKLDGEGGVLHFRLTDTVPLRVSTVKFNESLAGLSR